MPAVQMLIHLWCI